MYRVSPFVRHFAWALAAGSVVATVWVNAAPASYYDAIEARLAELALPGWVATTPISLTPLVVVSNALMALFLAFIGKELWEAVVLERGPLQGRAQAALPAGAVLGGMLGAALVWLVVGTLIETAEEAAFGTGWTVALGGDVVLCYVLGRQVFGAGHPALHLLLLIVIAFDLLGLAMLGVATVAFGWHLLWLGLPLVASLGVWLLFGARAHAGASEVQRRRAFALWPYVVAGLVSYTGVALAGLPPALGLLPVIPAIPHADRTFGLFAEAEGFLHDPLNRLAHLVVYPLAIVLFGFGLVCGGIDLGAYAPTTLTVLAALWIGKPLGLLVGAGVAAVVVGGSLPVGIRRRDLGLIAGLCSMGFTVPLLALDRALPGGAVTEAARLGLGISLLAGLVVLGLARVLRQ